MSSSLFVAFAAAVSAPTSAPPSLRDRAAHASASASVLPPEPIVAFGGLIGVARGGGDWTEGGEKCECGYKREETNCAVKV